MTSSSESLLFPALELASYQQSLMTTLEELQQVLTCDEQINQLVISLFGTTANFLDRYCAQTNRGPSQGIPDGFTKLQALSLIAQTNYQELVREGISLFGTPQAFTQWLMSENFALGGKMPLQYLWEGQTQEIVNLLGRISYGIPS